MIINKATISDAEEVVALQKVGTQSEAEICNDSNIPPLIQTSKSTKEDFENHFFLNPLMDKRIIESVRACSRKGTCYIGRRMVHPDFQNRGIGTRLMNEIERILNS